MMITTTKLHIRRKRSYIEKWNMEYTWICSGLMRLSNYSLKRHLVEEGCNIFFRSSLASLSRSCADRFAEKTPGGWLIDGRCVNLPLLARFALSKLHRSLRSPQTACGGRVTNSALELASLTLRPSPLRSPKTPGGMMTDSSSASLSQVALELRPSLASLT